MPILRAGVTLFVTTVVLSALAMSALFFLFFFPGGFSLTSPYPFWFAAMVAVVVGPATLLLMHSANAGWRRRLVTGLGSMFGLGLAGTIILYILALQAEPLSASYAVIVWVPFLLGVPAVSSAFLLCYFVLRRWLGLQPLFDE